MARLDVGTGANTISGSTGSFVDTFKDLSYDQDYDIINSYNFMLRVEGIFSIAVRNIRGINKQLEYEHVQEGGLNDYVHALRKPVTQPYTFTVERYMSQDWLEDFYDPLALGTEFLLPLILYINRNARSDGKLPVRYYVFTGARVSGVQVGDLDAEKSGLHTVTYTIMYSNLISFTLPIAKATTPDPYKFAKDQTTPNKEAKYARTTKNMGLEHQDPVAVDDPSDPDAAHKALLATAKTNPKPTLTKGEMAALAKDYRQTRDKEWKDRWDEEKKLQEEANKELGLPRKFELPPKKTDAEGDTDPSAEDPAYKAPGARKYPETESAQKPPEIETDDEATGLSENPKARKYVYNPTMHAGQKSEESAVKPTEQLTKAQMQGRAKGFVLNPEKHPGKTSSEQAKKPEGQLTKSEMESKAKGFVLNPEAHTGKTSSEQAKKPEGQLSREQMEARAKIYPPDRSTREPDGNLSKEQMAAQARKYPTDRSTKDPEGQLTKEQLANKSRKYPPQRSARDVAEFLK